MKRAFIIYGLIEALNYICLDSWADGVIPILDHPQFFLLLALPHSNTVAKCEDTGTQANLWMLDHVKLVASTYENLFSKNNQR